MFGIPTNLEFESFEEYIQHLLDLKFLNHIFGTSDLSGACAMAWRKYQEAHQYDKSGFFNYASTGVTLDRRKDGKNGSTTY
jgi:hypothetical protein